MPKIDPVTGCTVLTMPEALNRMAQDEGRLKGVAVEWVQADVTRPETLVLFM